jgi:hypothetical protein
MSVFLVSEVIFVASVIGQATKLILLPLVDLLSLEDIV